MGGFNEANTVQNADRKDVETGGKRTGMCAKKSPSVDVVPSTKMAKDAKIFACTDKMEDMLHIVEDEGYPLHICRSENLDRRMCDKKVLVKLSVLFWPHKSDKDEVVRQYKNNLKSSF